MGDDFEGGGGVPVPANMTEQEVIDIVRELLEDDLLESESDAQLMLAYRSGTFQELCPAIAEYAKAKAKQQRKPSKSSEQDCSGSKPVPSGSVVEKGFEKVDIKPVKGKRGHSSNSESESGGHSRHSHEKKKKKKHERCKDKEQKREKDHHHKDKSKSPDREKSTVKMKQEITSSDSEDERKPFTAYSSETSHITFKRWKPVQSREHARYGKMFRLKPCSIACLDLLDLPIMFHNPEKPSKNPNSMPLTSNLELDESHVQTIRRLERDKLTWFKGELTRQALKLKDKKGRGRDSGQEKVTRKRILDEMDSSSNANSSASSNRPASSKKPKNTKSDSNDGDRGGCGKLTKAVKEAEAKKRKLEEISKKAEKMSARGTGVLPWEKKDKKKKKDASKRKELAEEEKKKAELARREKLEKQKIVPVPSVHFQRIIASIEAAKKVEAREPRVELKIPNLFQQQQQQKQAPPTEKNIADEISVGDVAKEVTRLLSSDVKVELPEHVMRHSAAEDEEDLDENLQKYTVEKIAWWLLHMEKDPPDQVVFHPERHDDDDLESIHSEDFDWPSDTSSINGRASDPELIIPLDPVKIRDPDWADEYCGDSSLRAMIRKDTANSTAKHLASMDSLVEFFGTKPGTNYSKTNFEANCRICDKKIKGQRQLGAHIRSNYHKDNFRNFSLNMAAYEENVQKPAAKKEFIATLVDPGTTNYAVGVTEESIRVDLARKMERMRSESPDPSITVPDDDAISLPSISDESLMNVKVALCTSRKWDRHLEKKWRTWKDEEARIVAAYNREREFFRNEPNRHPSYQEEWLKFWEKRCIELEAEGEDTDAYDFQEEWEPFWRKRMQEIMKEQVEEKVHARKEQLGVDKHTLRATYNVSAEATRRKKKTEKVDVGSQEQENSGSFRSSANVDSSPAPASRRRQQMQPLSSSRTQFNPGHHRSNNYQHRGDNYRDRDYRQQQRSPHRSQHYRSNNQKQNRYHRERGKGWYPSQRF